MGTLYRPPGDLLHSCQMYLADFPSNPPYHRHWWNTEYNQPSDFGTLSVSVVTEVCLNLTLFNKIWGLFPHLCVHNCKLFILGFKHAGFLCLLFSQAVPWLCPHTSLYLSPWTLLLCLHYRWQDTNQDLERVSGRGQTLSCLLGNVLWLQHLHLAFWSV